MVSVLITCAMLLTVYDSTLSTLPEHVLMQHEQRGHRMTHTRPNAAGVRGGRLIDDGVRGQSLRQHTQR